MIKINDDKYKNFQDFFNQNTDQGLSDGENHQLLMCFLAHGLAELRDALQGIRAELDKLNGNTAQVAHNIKDGITTYEQNGGGA